MERRTEEGQALVTLCFLMAHATWVAASSFCHYDSLSNLELWAKINSVLGFYCCDKKPHDQKQLWKKGFFSASISQVTYPFHQGSQGRNSKQEPGGENWNREHGEECCSLAWSSWDVLCFFRHPWTTCPGTIPPTLYWVLPCQPSLKACLQVNVMGCFLSWTFLFPDYPALCQADTHTNTQI